METDVRKIWFWQQHFTLDELQKIYDWEQISGKIGEVVPIETGFCLHHIEDKNKELSLCFMKEESQLRRWAERLAYKTNDGITAQQFDDQHGIKDPEIDRGEEIYRNKDRTTIVFHEKSRKFTVCSGDYALVAKRTAANAFEILLLNNEEYAEHLKTQK